MLRLLPAMVKDLLYPMSMVLKVEDNWNKSLHFFT